MVSISFDPATLGLYVAILLGLVFVIFVLRAIWRGLRRLFFSPKLHGLDRAGILARWNEVERMANDGSEVQLKIALMEADKLLDHGLKAMAMPGMTLGERLKFAAYRYPNIRKVWNAHRLRNQLAHESSFYLEPSMAKRAIKDFKEALQLLNLL